MSTFNIFLLHQNRLNRFRVSSWKNLGSHNQNGKNRTAGKGDTCVLALLPLCWLGKAAIMPDVLTPSV